MQHSTKKIRPLSELVADRIFVLPKRMANDIDLKSGKPCVFVGINGKSHYIPVEEPTPISYTAFCVLRDLGLPYREFKEGELL